MLIRKNLTADPKETLKLPSLGPQIFPDWAIHLAPSRDAAILISGIGISGMAITESKYGGIGSK